MPKERRSARRPAAAAPQAATRRRRTPASPQRLDAVSMPTIAGRQPATASTPAAGRRRRAPVSDAPYAGGLPAADVPRPAAHTSARRRTVPPAHGQPALLAIDPAQLRSMVVAAVQGALHPGAAPAPPVATHTMSTGSVPVPQPPSAPRLQETLCTVASPSVVLPAEPISAPVDQPPATPPRVADAVPSSPPPDQPMPAVSVAAPVRQRIVADKYIALGMLLDGDDALADQAPAFQLMDGLLRPMARAPRVISSFGTWSMAFVKFAAVYLEAHPEAAAGLLAHMRQVSSLLAPGLGFAWREFDEAFRRARETAPALHPWGGMTSSSPLWLHAVARGIGAASRPTSAAGRPGPAGDGRFRLCFGFNQSRGCRSRQCKFAHVCRLCKGAHPATRCPARPQQQRPNAPPATAGASR